MRNGLNKPLHEQVDILQQILKLDEELYSLIVAVSRLELPQVYVGAGCVNQSVWNEMYSNDIGYGISDVDIVYFDEDLSEEKELKVIE